MKGNLLSRGKELIGMGAATSAGTARAEAPGLSRAMEKAGAVPAKSVRHNGNQRFLKSEFVKDSPPHTRFKY